jgi:hypothetical protein
VRSLALQDGPFSAELAAGFFSPPHTPAAVRLRRWDEGAGIPGKATPSLEHFRPYLEASLLAWQSVSSNTPFRRGRCTKPLAATLFFPIAFLADRIRAARPRSYSGKGSGAPAGNGT